MHAPADLPLIPAEMLLMAYRGGIFPMADSREDEEIFWVEPKDRAVFPLADFRPGRSLRKVVRQNRFSVTCNTAFQSVIEACAAPRPGHPESWISRRIAASYTALHVAGHAHSIECWRNDELVGGLYGVGFDKVFCGESMFSHANNASKVALVWLIALLKRAGFEVLDCQFMTDHLATLGAVEMSQADYLKIVAQARGPTPLTLRQAYSSLLEEACVAGASPGKFIAQSFTQTS